jgi:hypothetical protein
LWVRPYHLTFGKSTAAPQHRENLLFRNNKE